jgi:hypothetical protein
VIVRRVFTLWIFVEPALHRFHNMLMLPAGDLAVLPVVHLLLMAQYRQASVQEETHAPQKNSFSIQAALPICTTRPFQSRRRARVYSALMLAWRMTSP